MREPSPAQHAAVRLHAVVPDLLRPLVSNALTEAPHAPVILVAEDHDDNRLIAATILRHAGFTVIEAIDGRQALDLARSARPALVLMDVSMPELDGWSVTRALRSEPHTRDMLVIALTAHALPEDRRRASEAGCDHFLTKPIGPQALLAAVRAALAGERDIEPPGTP